MEQIRIVEMGPRDGLQNEPVQLSAEVKAELVDRLTAAGLSHIEAGAFVSPKWVPQMAGTSEVFARIKRRPGVRYAALAPNMKGFEGALGARVDEIAIFTAASEAFTQRNINCSIDESFERFAPVVEAAKQNDILVRGYVSCVMGCPYEGEVAPEKVRDVAARLYEMGCAEISLGDTIGVGVHPQTRRLIRMVAEAVPVDKLAGHYHDTYGQALSNVWASIEEGVRVFDSSVSGLGGCPYAKGAAGNLATEDLVYALQTGGFETGVDLDALIGISRWISAQIGRAPSSRLALARG